MSEEVESELGLGKKMIPEKVGERVGNAGEDRQKVSFESSDDSLGDVVSLNIWGHKLERAALRVLDGQFVGLASLVVQDLQVHVMAAFF